jgi:LCP family protein required for cell wall assembly
VSSPPSFSTGTPATVLADASVSRRRPRRISTGFTIALLVGAAGTGGTLVAARDAIDSVERIDEVDSVLSAPSANVENFLLVGSDSREGADPNAPDFGGIGDESTVSGRRSDTIMVLRNDRSTGTASLLSIPRDLWVEIPGHGRSRINSAYNHGADVLVQTVEQALDIPVHHYLEIDFSGFKDLVDAIGGYQHCWPLPQRDVSTGFNFPQPGCFVIDGVQALAYARSRHLEQFEDGGWEEVTFHGPADLGRGARQREFVKKALQAALDEVKSNPFTVGDVMSSAGGSIRVDANLDVIDAVSSLRDAVADIQTYALPVTGRTIDGNAVLEMTSDADAMRAYFRGEGPPPARGAS